MTQLFSLQHIHSLLKRSQLYSYFSHYKKSSLLILLLLFIALPLTLFFSLQQTRISSSANGTLAYDIVVVGGGTGGVSAAIQAARQGVRVAIVEPTDWLGGQMSAAAVSTMDEGYSRSGVVIERDSGIYKEFVQRVSSKYGGLGNVHKCYWGADSICVEPGVAKDVVTEMVASTGNIDIFYRTRVTQIQKTGNTITGVLTHSSASNDDNILQAKVVIDATEYGDVIPLTGADYRLGKYIASSGIDESALNTCMQDITYHGTIKRYDNGIPANLQMTQEPPNYQAARGLFTQDVSKTTPPAVGDNYPWSFTQFVGYRGIPDKSRPSTATPDSVAGLQAITKTGINVQGNDVAQTLRFIQDQSYRQAQSCEAKLRTIQYLYYIQKDLNLPWSVADDEGFTTTFNTTENNCANIPAAFKEIEKRLPLEAYVRESRRVIGITTLTSFQIQAQKDTDHKTLASVKPTSFESAIALGGYNMDLHNCNTASTIDPSIDSPASVNGNHEKFQVPLESLIPASVDGFLVAEKNISQSRIANGATRLQPITMLTGQAAGALAAIAVKSNRQPRAVVPIEVQNVLLDGKSPISLFDLVDVTPDNPHWKAVQLISNYNIMAGYGDGRFGPSDTITRGIMAIVLTRLLQIPTDNTQLDAYTKIKEKGITSSASFQDFAPDDPLLKGQLALFMSRTLGNFPADGPAAINYLQGLGIGVGCNGADPTTCNVQISTRGDMADVAGALTKMRRDKGVQGGDIPSIPTQPPASAPVPTAAPAQNPPTTAQACPVDYQGFYDVQSDYQPASKCFNERYCIVRGFSAHMLGPDDILTRAQYVAFILRYHDQIVGDWKIISQAEVESLPRYPNKVTNPETGKAQFLFTDVDPSNSLAKEIYTSQKYGFIQGYQDGSFLPDEEWYFGFHGVTRNDAWPLGQNYVFTQIGSRVKRIDFLRGLYTYGKYHGTLPACNDLPNIQYP
jgi:hypothetical protein